MAEETSWLLHCLQDAMASQISFKQFMPPFGFTLIISHKPLNACSFSTPSRNLRIATHHVGAMFCKADANSSAHCIEILPRVIAAFSPKLRLTIRISRIPAKDSANARACGCNALGSHRIANSPAAQHALLQHDTVAAVIILGAKFCLAISRNSLNDGLTCCGHAFETSPKSANAERLTEGVSSTHVANKISLVCEFNNNGSHC
mmetsp:Transcript_1450/g.4416  ORF Transcript_1450/g.4416 Transcript_1450/m.4416 type:complete len:204 (-) Transcript_1450:2181-2792(-)